MNRILKATLVTLSALMLSCGSVWAEEGSTSDKQGDKKSASRSNTVGAARQESQAPLDCTALSGAIGPYAINLFLDLTQFRGHYYYVNRPQSDFTLKCTNQEELSRDGNGCTVVALELKEYTEQGEHTGTFMGTLRMNPNVEVVFEGKFVNSRGKEFDFSVAAQ